MKKGLVFMAGILWLSGSPLLGQEPRIEEADLPRWVEEDVINFFNDPSTIHFTARTRIPSTRVVLGDVAALGGPFTIAGEVDGDLVVVNGDLVFETGGAVTGRRPGCGRPSLRGGRGEPSVETSGCSTNPSGTYSEETGSPRRAGHRIERGSARTSPGATRDSSSSQARTTTGRKDFP